MIDWTVTRNILRACLPRFLKSAYRTGGTDSARYCYAVWLRHLWLVHRGALRANLAAVTELGPGDSIGIGLAALLGGVERYAGLDVVNLIDRERNLAIFDELVELYRCRAPIPGDAEFPQVRPRLADYAFPADMLGDHDIDRNLAPARVTALRHELSTGGTTYETGRAINYVVPWASRDALPSASQDLVFSQGVLQFVPDIASVYAAMYHWLRPGGVISHRISFDSHGTATRWNGHWAYSDLAWRLVNGFFGQGVGQGVNREPMSRHLQVIRDSGFEILDLIPSMRRDGIDRRQLARRFRHLGNEELETNGIYVLARKPWAADECIGPSSTSR